MEYNQCVGLKIKYTYIRLLDSLTSLVVYYVPEQHPGALICEVAS